VKCRKVVEEFIQFDAVPEKITPYVADLLRSPEKLASMRQELSSIKHMLGEKGASRRAALAVLEFMD